MRRALFWTGVLVALAALVGGGLYGWDAYRATSGPDGAVKGYFAAISRGDAPAALAFGTVPEGPHDLLTSQVLAEQQKIAPLHDLAITDVARAGSQATVGFSYQLGFARGNQQVTGSLRVTDTSGGWRLASTAVATTVRVEQAADRMTFAGSSVPDGPTLLFPGALPIAFDTPYLAVKAGTADVHFGGDATSEVTIVATPDARADLAGSLTATLDACAHGSVSSDCPLPTGYVPGSFDGRIVGDVGDALSFDVSPVAAGAITVNGTITFRGTYRRLTYDNITRTRHGTVRLPVSASAYAVAPLTPRFEPTS